MRWHLPNKIAGLNSKRSSLPWLKKIISSGNISSGKDETAKNNGKKNKKKQQQHNPLKQVFFTEHVLSPDQLADLFPLARIDSGNLLASRGISQEEASLRLVERRHLQNPNPKLRTLLARLLRSLLHQFLHSFRLLLLFSTLLCFAYFFFNQISLSIDDEAQQQSSALWLALLQLVALLAICLVSVAQKFQIKRLNNKAFITVLPSPEDFYTAIREGRRSPVRCNEILEGDLLLLKAGQRVPADVRLLYILDAPFLVDCAWLAVEPATEPVEYTANIAPKHMDVFQARNVVFTGFLCTQGSALGLVIRTGKQTLFSRLSARSLTTTNNENLEPTAPLSGSNIITAANQVNGIHLLEIDYLRLVHWICWISLCIAFVFFLAVLLLLSNGPFTVDPFAAFIYIFLILLISNLPQAVPLTFGAQLLLIGRQLKQRCCGGMILKDMQAADTLGRTSVLMIHNPTVFCTNRPSLTNIWLAGSNQELSADKFVDWAVSRRSKEKPQQNWTLHGNNRMDDQYKLADRFGQQTLELLKTAAFLCKIIPPNQKNIAPKSPASDSQRRRSLTFWELLRRPSLNVSKCSRVADITNGIPIRHPMPTSPETIPKPLFIGHLTHQSQLSQDKSTPIGDPIDVAILKFLEQLMPMDLWKSGMGLLQQELTSQPIGNLMDWRTQVITIARRIEDDDNFNNGDGIAVNGDGQEGLQCRLMAKGAPEELLRNCTTVRTSTMEELPLTDELLLQFEEQFLLQSAAGKHCTGLAVHDLVESECPPYTSHGSLISSSSSTSALSSDEWTDWTTNNQTGGGWCFLGMLVFADSLQSGCAQSVLELKADGIRTVLISDEHPAVVQALAKKANLTSTLENTTETNKIVETNKPKKEAATRVKPISTTKMSSVKNLQQWIPSHIQSPFRRLHKAQSTTSSGYHSTEINAAQNKDDNNNEKHENYGKDEASINIAELIEEGWPIDGEFFAEMDSEQMNCLLATYTQQSTRNLLFSRLNPDQIGQLVKHFQVFGNTVTFVSQNGLFDGHALRNTDFGIAPTDCTVSGSLLAQQMTVALCSDMAFPNLVQSIRVGRIIRQNLASTLLFSLSHTPALLLPVALTLVFGFPLGLKPLQILSIALFTAIPPAVALVFKRPFYQNSFIKSNAPLLSRDNNFGLFLHSYLFAGTILAVGCLFAYLSVFWQSGVDISQLLSRTDLLVWKQQSDPIMESSENTTSFLTIEKQYEEENQKFMALSAQAAAAWQLTLVTAQLFHVWLCADHTFGNRISVQWYPWAIFCNFGLCFAILLDLCILLMLIYLPGLNFAVLGVQPPPAHVWLFPLVTGCVLLILHLLRKLALHRRWRAECDNCTKLV